MSIEIVIADAHKLMREGLSALFHQQPDIRVVGHANNGQEAVQLAANLNPRVVVMDVSMPDLNGIDATRQILSRNPKTKVIGLSMHSDRQFMDEMFRAGASGCLLKDSAFEELAGAIRSVASEESCVAPGLSREVSPGSRGAEELPPIRRLTEREREVLKLIAEGKGTKEIAADLHLSAKTVETHRQHLMEKLGVYTVAELTKYALREGLTTLEH